MATEPRQPRRRPAPATDAAPQTETETPLPEMEPFRQPEPEPEPDAGRPMRIGRNSAPRAAGEKQKKFTLLIDKNDGIEIDRMLPDNRAKFVRMVRDNPELMREIAGAAPDGGAAAMLNDGEIIGLLYDVIGQIGVSIARATCTDESAQRMKFTTEDKAVLVEPTRRVLAKYSFTLGRWGEEMILAATLGAVVYGKVQQLQPRPKPGEVLPFRTPASEPAPIAVAPEPEPITSLQP